MVKVIEEYVADLQKKTNRYVKLKNLPENISKKEYCDLMVTKRSIAVGQPVWLHDGSGENCTCIS